MAKKTRRAKKTEEHRNARSANIRSANIRPLYQSTGHTADWHPLENEVSSNENHEKKYVRKIKPQSGNQKSLMDAIENYDVVFATGPAGTGKTYVTVAKAVEALEAGTVSRIVLSRPAVEAGESLGYLPGALDEKMAPYLRPLYDALSDRIGVKRLKHYLQDGTIEIAPIAYMRGRTLNNAFVVVDEAQNCTYGQIKMLLTRLGFRSTMVLTGDPDQSDLLGGLSGLKDITGRVEVLEDIAVIYMEEQDIVRHPLVAAMLSVI